MLLLQNTFFDFNLLLQLHHLIGQLTETQQKNEFMYRTVL